MPAMSSTSPAAAAASPAVFRCPAELTIATAEALHHSLGALGDVAVVIDGSDVLRVDFAGLQVMLVAAVDWKRRGLGWTWSERSRLLDDAAKLIGLWSLLDGGVGAESETPNQHEGV